MLRNQRGLASQLGWLDRLEQQQAGAYLDLEQARPQLPHRLSHLRALGAKTYSSPAWSTVNATLSTNRAGAFSFPLPSLRGPLLGPRREADARAATASTPWFVYGGSNSVGGQALVRT